MTNTSQFLVWFANQTRLVRYFTVAVLLHALFACVLGSIKIVTSIIKPPPVTPSWESRKITDLESPGDDSGAPPTQPISLPINPGFVATGRSRSPAAGPLQPIGVESPIGRNPSDTTFGNFDKTPFSLPGSMNGGGVPGPTAVFGTGNINRGGKGFLQRTGTERGNLIGRYKGTTNTEVAVLGALRWLKDHQGSNGSWAPTQNPEAMSALATLCFLGHGETADSDEFGPTVSKGMGYLVAVIGPSGIVKSGNMYAQGAVTLALSEAYGMTQSPLVREPLERAVNAIVLAQKAKKTKEADIGGWRYSPVSDSSDVSVSGWLVMGLKSARLAGISIPDEVFELAAKYLWNMYGEAGGFGYSNPGSGYNTSAVGILCQQFLGHGDDKRIKKALNLYKEDKVNWETDAHAYPLYGWYYATQAMFQAGGSYWEHWNKEIRDTLVKAQATDGHWDGPGNKAVTYGPVYSTTLCCLMLEVYYRYLPIYQEMEKKTFPLTPTQSASAK